MDKLHYSKFTYSKILLDILILTFLEIEISDEIFKLLSYNR